MLLKAKPKLTAQSTSPSIELVIFKMVSFGSIVRVSCFGDDPPPPFRDAVKPGK